MPVRLQTLRLYITTKDVPRAGTDDRVFLQLGLPGKPVIIELSNPGNDRERGRTDFYEVSLTNGVKLADANGGEAALSSSGSTNSASVPPGVEFESWQALWELPLQLALAGINAWRFFKYHVIARVVELIPLENPIDSAYEIGFDDWVLMASHDGDVLLSAQGSDGGSPTHSIAINGTLPPGA